MLIPSSQRSLHPGFAYRLPNYDEVGQPHVVRISPEVAERAVWMRARYHNNRPCNTFRDPLTAEVYVQEPDGQCPPTKLRPCCVTSAKLALQIPLVELDAGSAATAGRTTRGRTASVTEWE